MKIRHKIPLLAFILFYSLNLYSQANLIFDTDIGGDADDLGALAMLHHFVDNKECNLLGIMAWTVEENAVKAIDAVNRFYGHPNIPIGTRKAQTFADSTNYNKAIATHFQHKLNYSSVPDATKLYRKLLSQSADSGVTIVVVGPMANIRNLILSKADKYSALTGKELIRKKVKEFVVMGGQFPSGENEWNFNGNMPGVTKFVLENLEVPVIFSGFEIGASIKTGEVFNQIDPNTPLYVGFMYFSQHAPWIKEYFKGKILDNSTFDQTAVLYAVRNGTGKWWEKESDGYCLADDSGGNKWVKGNKYDHSYLKLIAKPDEMERLIESLMLGK